MPVFVLHTNVPESKIKIDFLKSLSKSLAELLQKPESYVCVRVHGGQLMTFGGNDKHCGVAYLESLGSVGGEKNKAIVAEISKLVGAALDIPKDRLFVKISDVARSDMGFNGTTFG